MLLSVQDERALLNIEDELRDQNEIQYSAFREPDIQNELTSIAIMPSENARKFCKNFKLAKLNNTHKLPHDAQKVLHENRWDLYV